MFTNDYANFKKKPLPTKTLPVCYQTRHKSCRLIGHFLLQQRNHQHSIQQFKIILQATNSLAHTIKFPLLYVLHTHYYSDKPGKECPVIFARQLSSPFLSLSLLSIPRCAQLWQYTKKQAPTPPTTCLWPKGILTTTCACASRAFWPVPAPAAETNCVLIASRPVTNGRAAPAIFHVLWRSRSRPLGCRNTNEKL